MSQNDSFSRDQLQKQIADIRASQADNKYELLKEIHRVKDNSLKNLAAIVTVVLAVTGYLGWEYLIPEAVNNEISRQTNQAVTELGRKISEAVRLERSLSSPLIVYVSDHGDSDPVVGTLYKSSPRARIHVTPKPNEYNLFSGLHASWSLLKLSGRFPSGTIFVSPSNLGDPVNDLLFLRLRDLRGEKDPDSAPAGTEGDSLYRTLYFVGYDGGAMDLIQNHPDFRVLEYRKIKTPRSLGRLDFDSYRTEKLVEVIQGIALKGEAYMPEPSERIGRLGLGLGRYPNRLTGSEDYWYKPVFDGEKYTGVVVEVDDFGNITTNLRVEDLMANLGINYGDAIEVLEDSGATHRFTLGHDYMAVKKGDNVCISLDGYLQLAISYGNLEGILKWRPEHPVHVRRPIR